MKRSFLIAVLMLVGLAATVPGYAETVQGEVKEISPKADYVKLDRHDPQSGKTEEIKLAVDQSTQFSGQPNSLSELKIGDAVVVEADQNVITRQWRAKMISTGAPMAGGV